MTSAPLLAAAMLLGATTLASAADPPGFPSSPGPAVPAPGPVAPGPVAASAADDFARERMAAIAKFARDKEEDPRFAEREGPNGACRVDQERRVVMLTFNADGTLHCKAPLLAESYQLEVHVLTVKSLYATGNHYRITAKPGAPLRAVSVHGTAADVKAAVTAMAGMREDYTETQWWQAPRLLGPFHNEDVTVTVALAEAGVREDTTLSITPLSTFNLGVLGLMSPGVTTYSAVDGALDAHRRARELSYYFGVHFYPLSWARIAKKRLRPGRYFVPEYVAFADRLSVVAGIDLANPRQAGYLGLALEVYGGVALTAGWQPRQVQRLRDGAALGDPITGDEVPTDSAWDLERWAVGLSVDASFLKPIVGYLAR
ncbi:MAG: hypothetical protein IPI49_13700 [Myxococcales bacterium]|nr:hypothetical protein [Myxococcales bacterium]